MIYVLEIREKAIGKGRPRINTITHTAYTPEKTKTFEKKLQMYFIKKYGKPGILSENPFRIEIRVEIKPPKNTSRKKTMILYDKPYTKKPDIDNIQKIILDSLNGLAYKDDKQVFKSNIEKVYGITDRIIIFLEEII